MVEYHDTERGDTAHDDRKHFEYLVLDVFQARTQLLKEKRATP
ncbi:MAG: DNA-3-methyladenine glycosylase I [Gammaproteobacteria bacterium]|nr:DNA-3-methyladenine glycosylase I [Gammaproteobacteria bacterium]